MLNGKGSLHNSSLGTEETATADRDIDSFKPAREQKTDIFILIRLHVVSIDTRSSLAIYLYLAVSSPCQL